MNKEKTKKDLKSKACISDMHAFGSADYGEVVELVEEEEQPDFVSPMLATLTDEYFDSSDWIYERKLDGERILAFKKGNGVRLLTRNRKPANHNYPEIVEFLKKQGGDFVVDGEVVVFSENGSDFEALQPRMHASSKDMALQTGVEPYYYVFDLIYCEGYNLQRLPLIRRKKLLKNLFNFKSPVIYLGHIKKDGLGLYKKACQQGWEGVIAKKAESRYIQKRSKLWLKFKCSNEQEFVIGGYTDPQRSRIGFGSLLLGYYQRNQLKYAGKVGTGFSDEQLKRIKAMLKKLEIKASPFAEDLGNLKGVHFVEPNFVVEVGFTEWTSQGHLRHPKFLGLRRDKDPLKVRRERSK